MQEKTPQELEKLIPKRLLKTFAIITIFMIALIVIMMPYRLYERDVMDARQRAKEISDLVKIGILSTMISTGESKDIRQVIGTYSDKFDFQFRLIRSQFVEKQHGIKEDPQGKDTLINDVLNSGKAREDWLDSTTFRYVVPFVSDKRCQKCHEGLDGKTIPTGKVLGVSQIIFDLSEVKSKSIRFIAEIMILITFSILGLGVALFFIVKNGIMEFVKS